MATVESTVRNVSEPVSVEDFGGFEIRTYGEGFEIVVSGDGYFAQAVRETAGEVKYETTRTYESVAEAFSAAMRGEFDSSISYSEAR